MRSCSLTQDSLCINPRHSPSLLSNKRKHTGVLFLAGEQEVGLGTKLAALNDHRHRHRHHLCPRRSIRSGSWPCRCVGSPPGISQAGDTPRNHTRPVDRDGRRPMKRHRHITRPTPRGYHNPSIHDSPLRTVGCWTTSTLASEDWKSSHVKFKIHLTLMCRIRDSGSYSSSNRLRTSTRC
jgi:hypothetical protein